VKHGAENAVCAQLVDAPEKQQLEEGVPVGGLNLPEQSDHKHIPRHCSQKIDRKIGVCGNTGDPKAPLNRPE